MLVRVHEIVVQVVLAVVQKHVILLVNLYVPDIALVYALEHVVQTVLVMVVKLHVQAAV